MRRRSQRGASLDPEPGLEVVGEAESGEAGVEMAGTLHPDVVIMDVMLPGMGGIEATRRIHSLPGDTRVLLLAAQGLTAAEIGKKLFLSPKTVETYRSRSLRKLGLETRAELVAFAQRTGILRG
jgi:DNA-binding NarL/FixJ family response regulator